MVAVPGATDGDLAVRRLLFLCHAGDHTASILGVPLRVWTVVGLLTLSASALAGELSSGTGVSGILATQQEPTGPEAGAPVPVAPPAAESGALPPRLGRFRVGGVFLTPYFTIGTIGVDANVFFTQTGRTRDITASGGPGLKMVVPLGRQTKLSGDGYLNYLWFAEQADQRRLMGGASGRMAFEGNKLGAGVEGRYTRSFQRVDFEVDQRVDQTSRELLLDGRLGGGESHVRVSPRLTVRRYEVADPEFGFAGVYSTLSRDEFRVLLPVHLRLTPKTWFVLEAEATNYGFLYDTSRDGNLYRFGVGFELQSPTRLSGRVLAGPSLFRPKEGALPELRTPWVAVEVNYAVGLRTSLEGRYRRDIGYSGTSTGANEAPLRTNEEVIAGWTQRVAGRIGTRIWGGVSRFETVGEVWVPGGGGTTAASRDDKIRQGGLDLTYEIAPKLTLGVGGYYTERQSNVQAFGVEGFSFGVIFNYNGPVSVAFRP